MKKKWIALMLTLVMCMSLAACGGRSDGGEGSDSKVVDSQGESNEGNSGESSKESEAPEEVEPYEPTYGEVEIEFWNHMDGERFEVLAQEYMDLHPNVKINVLNIGFWDMSSKLMPALAGGTAPDIILNDLASAQQRLADEQTVDLTEHLKARGFDSSQFIPASVECVLYNGRWAALPYLTDTRILYYNKDHFAEAGLETPPATWDEVLEYAKKLTKFDADGNVERVGFHTSLGNFYTWTLMWTFGAELLDGETPTFNSPEAVAAMEYALEVQEAVGGYDAFVLFAEGTQSTTVDPFIMGDVSMSVNTNETAANIMRDNPDLNWGAAVIPTVDGVDNHASWSGGFDLEFTDHGEDRLNAAIDFGLWMLEKEQQVTYGTKSGAMMCNIEAMDEIASMYPEFGEEYWNAVKESRTFTRYLPYLEAYPAYNSAINGAAGYILEGTKEPQQALDDAAEIVRQEVENYHFLYD